MSEHVSIDIEPIGHIHRDGKLASGDAASWRGTLVFEPRYRSRDAVRGLEGFSDVWLIWGEGPCERDDTQEAAAEGQAALRISCVHVLDVCLEGPAAPTLALCGELPPEGAPLYDLKPYVPYADAHPDALPYADPQA